MYPASLMEIIFDTSYLIVIYASVALMKKRQKYTPGASRAKTSLFIIAFLLLALGDTGHVGLRVAAHLLGGLQRNAKLVGAGSFATALTVTVFYALMLEFFHLHTGRKRGALYWGLVSVSAVRIVFLFLPGNNWDGAAPLSYSWIRNGMLTAVGVCVAALFIGEGIGKKDKPLLIIGGLMVLSYLFYIPVILFVQIVPSIGMLMIPKTCAYVAIAFTGLKYFFAKSDS